jgi:G3E family GTPase
MDRRGFFDYILLETTGLADPGNIAPLFWVDEGLGSSIYLDGIVTLVDAKNIIKSLDDPIAMDQGSHGHQDGDHTHPNVTTAHLQLSHADVIVVNKTDLVTREGLNSVLERIRSINSAAKVHITSHSQVPRLEGVLLDLHAYDSVGVEELDFASQGHARLDPTISTITISIPALAPSKLETLDAWLRSVLWESHLPASTTTPEITPNDDPLFEIHRLKARIPFTDRSIKIVQGVREIFEIMDERETVANENITSKSDGKIVFIGRSLNLELFKASIFEALEIS